MEVEEHNSRTVNNETGITACPNPGRGPVSIKYVLNNDVLVNCRVYDASGRVIRELVTARQPASRQSVIWDRTDNNGRAVTAGVYFVRVQAGTSAEQVKLVIVD